MVKNKTTALREEIPPPRCFEDEEDIDEVDDMAVLIFTMLFSLVIVPLIGCLLVGVGAVPKTDMEDESVRVWGIVCCS